MNVEYYKSWMHQSFESLKKAHYVDWFKACLCINFIRASIIPCALLILMPILTKGDVNFLAWIETYSTIITQAAVGIIVSSMVSALVYYLGFQYAPRLFIIFMIGKDLLITIAGTIKNIELKATSLLTSTVSFFSITLFMLGTTYATIILVIRSIKNRERREKASPSVSTNP